MFDLTKVQACEKRTSEQIAKLCHIPLRDIMATLFKNKTEGQENASEEKT